MDNSSVEKANVETIRALQNSLYWSIGLSNLPEFRGYPDEDVTKFLKEFGKAATGLTEEQKCLALKKCLVGDASIFSKKYLKEYLSKGEWKKVKEELKRRFSKVEPCLLYRTELRNMVFDSTKSTLLGYIDKFADLYKKVHENAQDNELIQDISLNLGRDIVLKLNQLSSEWKRITDFEEFRKVVSRLERDIISLENESRTQSTNEVATIVNKLVSSALEEPIKGMKDIITQLSQKSTVKEDTENLAAIKHGCYPNPPYKEYRQDYRRKREREWEDNRERQRFKNNNQQEPTLAERANELRRAYDNQFGEVSGVCYYCGGYHFRRHCPLEMPDLKEKEDRR